MAELRKELKVEEKEEKTTRQMKKEELKLEDYVDATKELTGLVKHNYLAGLQVCLSLWEANQKIVSSQVDQWMAMQEGCMALTRDLLEKFPAEIVKFWNENFKTVGGHLDKILVLQKDYPGVLMETSHKFTRDASEVMKDALEKAFSVLDVYIEPGRG